MTVGELLNHKIEVRDVLKYSLFLVRHLMSNQ